MDYLTMTKKYYARWLGTDVTCFDKTGVHTFCSTERDISQEGYQNKFDLYCLANKESIYISYSERLKDSIKKLTDLIKQTDNYNNIEKILSMMYSGKVGHNIKFFFSKLISDINTTQAIKLKENDYDDYFKFFITQNPCSNPNGWLKEYFLSLVEKGYCWGIKKDNKLVSVTDAPDIPYMKDTIVEPGINTLSKYRKNGYAKIVTSAFLEIIISQNKVPIWSCNANNKASENLAKSVGYKKFADVFTVSL